MRRLSFTVPSFIAPDVYRTWLRRLDRLRRLFLVAEIAPLVIRFSSPRPPPSMRSRPPAYPPTPRRSAPRLITVVLYPRFVEATIFLDTEEATGSIPVLPTN